MRQPVQKGRRRLHERHERERLLPWHLPDVGGARVEWLQAALPNQRRLRRHRLLPALLQRRRWLLHGRQVVLLRRSRRELRREHASVLQRYPVHGADRGDAQVQSVVHKQQRLREQLLPEGDRYHLSCVLGGKSLPALSARCAAGCAGARALTRARTAGTGMESI